MLLLILGYLPCADVCASGWFRNETNSCMGCVDVYMVLSLRCWLGLLTNQCEQNVCLFGQESCSTNTSELTALSDLAGISNEVTFSVDKLCSISFMEIIKTAL